MGTEHTPHASLPRDFTQGEAWDCVLEVWTLFPDSRDCTVGVWRQGAVWLEL